MAAGTTRGGVTRRAEIRARLTRACAKVAHANERWTFTNTEGLGSPRADKSRFDKGAGRVSTVCIRIWKRTANAPHWTCFPSKALRLGEKVPILSLVVTLLRKIKFVSFGIVTLCRLAHSSFAQNASVTYAFSGLTDTAIGSIPEGTPFSGVFTYDVTSLGITTPYYGGSEIIFADAYSALTVTIGSSAVSETAPGTIALFENISEPSPYVPIGDSLVSFNPLNFQGPNSSTGEFTDYGLTPDSIYLSLSDSTGTAFSGPTLPLAMNLSEFQGAILGIDYGPLGTGNTDTFHNLSSLTEVPEPTSGGLILLGLVALFERQLYYSKKLIPIKAVRLADWFEIGGRCG